VAIGQGTVVMRLTARLSLAFFTISLSLVASPATANEATEGKAIFMKCCASCHGLTGEGNGRLASSLTTPPANLRLLSQRFGNPLPPDVIARYIDSS